jgi:hypothetical protein
MRRARAAISVPPHLWPLLDRPPDWPPSSWRVSVAACRASGVVAWAAQLQAPGAKEPYWLTGRSRSQPHSLQSECVPALIAVLEILGVSPTDVDAHRCARCRCQSGAVERPNNVSSSERLTFSPRPATGLPEDNGSQAAGGRHSRLRRRRRVIEATSRVRARRRWTRSKIRYAKLGSSLSQMIPTSASAALQLQQSRHRTCLQGATAK